MPGRGLATSAGLVGYEHHICPFRANRSILTNLLFWKYYKILLLCGKLRSRDAERVPSDLTVSVASCDPEVLLEHRLFRSWSIRRRGYWVEHLSLSTIPAERTVQLLSISKISMRKYWRSRRGLTCDKALVFTSLPPSEYEGFASPAGW